jgi:hypothetical protein
LPGYARVGVELAAFAAAGPGGLKACELAKRADMAMGMFFIVVLKLTNIILAPVWAKAMVAGPRSTCGSRHRSADPRLDPTSRSARSCAADTERRRAWNAWNLLIPQSW